MRLNHNNTIVSLFLGVHLLQEALGRFQPHVQALPSEVTPGQSSLQDRLFKLPSSSPRHNRFYPRKKNLKTKKLLKRLGKAFDPIWMSIEQPVHLHEIIANKVDHKLEAEVRHINFSLKGLSKSNSNITSAVLAVFQEWLIERGSCPVHFLWEDLGINFWPRWLKRGFCFDEDSCSWPPGMHCLPAQSRRLRLLRWQCVPRHGHRFKQRKFNKDQENADSNTTENLSKKQRKRKYGMKCKWIKIPHPVTDECFCSC